MSVKTQVKDEDTILTEFSYDTFDRTTSIKTGDKITSFVYDCDGERVSKTTGSKVTESVLDNGSISADIVNNNGTVTTKVYTVDNAVFIQNGVITLNAIDCQGDIVSVDYNHNAYGIKTNSGETANPIDYRNYYYDNETGLYYLKARYYDPTTGQFTQEDTVQNDNLQYNLYGYCSANPVRYKDPSGHKLIISELDEFDRNVSEKNREKIFNCIRKLTNNRLVYYRNDKFDYTVSICGRPKNEHLTPNSDNIITGLIGSNHTFTIYYTDLYTSSEPTNSNNAMDKKRDLVQLYFLIQMQHIIH